MIKAVISEEPLHSRAIVYIEGKKKTINYNSKLWNYIKMLNYE